MIVPLDIRNPSVAQQVLNVQMPAYKVEAELIGFKDIPPLKDTVESLQNSKEIFYGYMQEQILMGVISFKMDQTLLDIHRMVVHPRFFRRGIGKALVTYIIDSYRQRAETMVVRTGAANIPAICLYKSLGFKEVEHVQVNDHLKMIVLSL